MAFESPQSSKAKEVVDKLKMIDLNTLTPIEAMNVLFEMVDKVKD